MEFWSEEFEVNRKMEKNMPVYMTYRPCKSSGARKHFSGNERRWLV